MRKVTRMQFRVCGNERDTINEGEKTGSMTPLRYADGKRRGRTGYPLLFFSLFLFGKGTD